MRSIRGDVAYLEDDELEDEDEELLEEEEEDELDEAELCQTRNGNQMVS